MYQLSPRQDEGGLPTPAAKTPGNRVRLLPKAPSKQPHSKAAMLSLWRLTINCRLQAPKGLFLQHQKPFPSRRQKVPTPMLTHQISRAEKPRRPWPGTPPPPKGSPGKGSRGQRPGWRCVGGVPLWQRQWKPSSTSHLWSFLGHNREAVDCSFPKRP